VWRCTAEFSCMATIVFPVVICSKLQVAKWTKKNIQSQTSFFVCLAL
jgi:hypothetical protein